MILCVPAVYCVDTADGVGDITDIHTPMWQQQGLPNSTLLMFQMWAELSATVEGEQDAWFTRLGCVWCSFSQQILS